MTNYFKEMHEWVATHRECDVGLVTTDTVSGYQVWTFEIRWKGQLWDPIYLTEEQAQSGRSYVMGLRAGQPTQFPGLTQVWGDIVERVNNWSELHSQYEVSGPSEMAPSSDVPWLVELADGEHLNHFWFKTESQATFFVEWLKAYRSIGSAREAVDATWPKVLGTIPAESLVEDQAFTITANGKYPGLADPAPVTALQLLSSAANHIGTRGQTYDQPEGERSMVFIVNTFNHLMGQEMSERQGWMFMVCLKLCRLLEAPGFHRDSLEDAIAYLALMGECMAQDVPNDN